MFPTPQALRGARPDPRRLAVAGLLLVTLAACGGGDPDDDDGRAQRPADPACAERPELCQ